MSVSSNTLFHFTDEMDKIRKIIEQKSFWPKYSKEHGWNFLIAVPMTCFCDIPLSQIKNHIDWYGSYGLGLSKEWAIGKGISPVLYMTRHTVSLISFLTKGVNSKQERIRSILARMKPYIGENERNGKQQESYNYYNEREWRYVPNMDDKMDLCLKVKKNTDINDINKKTDDCKYRLSFEYSDIRYLFVDSENDRLLLLKTIDEIEMNDTQKILLKSKIMTRSQLEGDL